MGLYGDVVKMRGKVADLERAIKRAGIPIERTVVPLPGLTDNEPSN